MSGFGKRYPLRKGIASAAFCFDLTRGRFPDHLRSIQRRRGCSLYGEMKGL
jgi:hypothetical protein